MMHICQANWPWVRVTSKSNMFRYGKIGARCSVVPRSCCVEAGGLLVPLKQRLCGLAEDFLSTHLCFLHSRRLLQGTWRRKSQRWTTSGGTKKNTAESSPPPLPLTTQGWFQNLKWANLPICGYQCFFFFSFLYLCGFFGAFSQKSPHVGFQSLHVHFLCGLRIVDLNLVDLQKRAKQSV